MCVARQQLLENALLRLGQFHEAFAELLSWINESIDQLTNSTLPGVSIESLESQINELMVSE